MRYKNIILVSIVLLGFFFRFWQVNNVPPSLYWDEVSQGYNAYSILKTGRDEHQEFLPIARFQAFGDYKAPVYIYLDVPFIALFGKTELAVRLPSIVLGSLTVLLVYFLVTNLFKMHKEKEALGLLAAFFLSISPWHIQLSRAAFEANIATFFTILGVVLFLIAVRAKPWLIIVSALSFILAFYSFNAHRIFVPLLVIVLVLVEHKNILQIKKHAFISVVVGLLLLLPFLLYLKTPESKLRFQEVNIFSNIETIKKSNELVSYDESMVGQVVHNRRVLFGQEYVSNYFDFFTPWYLFLHGDPNPRFSDQENGQLFLWMLPLLLVGIYSLFFFNKKATLIILSWFILAPIAAATARETPHALRSETFIPLYEIIAAVGALSLYVFIKKNFQRYIPIVLVFFIGVVSFSIVHFWHGYLIHNPYLYSADWQYGYKQAVQKVHALEKDYDKIYFTNMYGRAYVYVAWYADFSPEKFWQEVDMKKDAAGFYNVTRLGKYDFSNNPTPTERRVLYVSPGALPAEYREIDKILFLNGKTAFIIGEKKI